MVGNRGEGYPFIHIPDTETTKITEVANSGNPAQVSRCGMGLNKCPSGREIVPDFRSRAHGAERLVDNQPYNWFVYEVEDIGIFEAKTKFPALCDQVVRSGTPVQVSRRGKPLVWVYPADPAGSQGSAGILESWKAWSQTHPESEESDFPEVWKMRNDKSGSPLDG